MCGIYAYTARQPFQTLYRRPSVWGGNDKSCDGGGRFGGLFDKYKIDRRGGGWAGKYGKKIIAWDTAPDGEFFEELFRVSENQIIWGANYFASMPPTRCFVVWRKPIPENFSMAMAEYAWTSFAANAKVYEGTAQGDKSDPRFHPTQKPVKLYAWLLRQFAKKGDNIFDPMMGSQSSRIAAYRLGYDYTGCELDKEYFDLGNERFARQCRGEIVTEKAIITQQSLFDDETE